MKLLKTCCTAANSQKSIIKIESKLWVANIVFENMLVRIMLVRKILLERRFLAVEQIFLVGKNAGIVFFSIRLIASIDFLNCFSHDFSKYRVAKENIVSSSPTLTVSSSDEDCNCQQSVQQ